jgi:hypothetical protein
VHAETLLKLVQLKKKFALKLVQNVIHSIPVAKNSLKQADVLTVSTKNTALNLSNNNRVKAQARSNILACFLLNKTYSFYEKIGCNAEALV